MIHLECPLCDESVALEDGDVIACDVCGVVLELTADVPAALPLAA